MMKVRGTINGTLGGHDEFSCAILVQKRPQTGFDMFITFGSNYFEFMQECRSFVEIQVLGVIFQNLGLGNEILISQADVARALGVRRMMVNRAYKSLQEKGILIENGTYGASKKYKVSAHYVWKGKFKDHIKAMQNELRQKVGTAQRRIEASI